MIQDACARREAAAYGEGMQKAVSGPFVDSVDLGSRRL